MSLPRPQGQQKRVVCLDHEGHTVVLGTAGSGKTTMAIHRAAYLSDMSTDHGGRTLLVTFNNALVTYLNYPAPVVSAAAPENREIRNPSSVRRDLGCVAPRGTVRGFSPCGRRGAGASLAARQPEPHRRPVAR
jgi:hypothetical protein